MTNQRIILICVDGDYELGLPTNHLVNWRLLHQHHVEHEITTTITTTMSLAVIQENEEDDGQENDMLTQSSTIHHKTRRETAFSLEGALISR